jgi:hypothetical protein
VEPAALGQEELFPEKEKEGVSNWLLFPPGEKERVEKERK